MTIYKSALCTLVCAFCFSILQISYSLASNANGGYIPDNSTGCTNGAIGILTGKKFFPNERSELYRTHGPDYVRQLCLPYAKAWGYKVEN